MEEIRKKWKGYKTFGLRGKCTHDNVDAERPCNQAWQGGYCRDCEGDVVRAYCARPGYGLPDEAEEVEPGV